MNTISISDLRSNFAGILNSLDQEEKTKVIMQRSKPKAVLVDYEYYKALEEAALDLSDAREAETAKSEPKSKLTEYYKKRFGQ